MAKSRLSVEDLLDLDHKLAQMFELIRRMKANSPNTAANLDQLTAWSQITKQAIGNARQYADQGELPFSQAWQIIAGYCLGHCQTLSQVVGQAIESGVEVVNSWDYDPNEIKP